MRSAQPFRIFLLLLAPPALWAAYFFLIYGAQTLACMSPAAANGAHFGLLAALTAALLAGLTLLAVSQWKQNGRSASGSSRFIAIVTLELILLAMIATVWVAMTFPIPLCA
jgi:hypothetical protein